MDAEVQAFDAIVASYRMLPIDLVDDSGHDMRRVKASARSDVALTASIHRRGVLQPIAVRPLGARYELVFGHRRLRCAKAAELLQIPADVRAWTDAEVLAIQKVENLQREEPHPIDVWCAVSDLVDAGYTIADAANELGLDDRDTRQMERLGRLHPDLLKLAELDMPAPHFLRAIANAPRKTQALAVKDQRAAPGWNNEVRVDWRTIAARCEVRRIPQIHAIFSAEAHPKLWAEDMFAQPDDPTRFSTTAIDGFMKLQRKALELLVEEQRAKRHRVKLVECDTDGLAALPKGWRLLSTDPGKWPRRTECVFMAIRPDGRISEVLAVDVAAQKAADKERDKNQKAKAKAEATKPATTPEMSADGDDEDGDRDDNKQSVVLEGKAPFTKAGLQMIADAKTKALRDALQDETAYFSLSTTLTLLVLALGAKNVDARIEDDPKLDFPRNSARRRFEDLAEQLLLPGGGLSEQPTEALVKLAMSALARLLTADGPEAGNYRTSYSRESGPPAEWIGAAIGAGEHLGRFDTEGFLAHVQGDALRRAAQAAGIKHTGSVKALREALVGKLPDWVPEQAQFGVPAPRLRT